MESYFKEEINVLSASYYLVIYEYFYYPLQYCFENGSNYSKLILLEFQLKETDECKLVDINRNILELKRGDPFDMQNVILNKVEEI